MGDVRVESSASNVHDGSVVETELLIVGAGPAGAALACFLSYHGLKGIMLATAPGTSDTPRAHITNMAALECLRNIGLEDECVKAATANECMQHTRWCRSMTGEDYARIHFWGNDPYRKGDYEAASPCKHVDLPQTRLEPILVRHATQHGFSCRFSTSFLSLRRETDGSMTSTVRDDLTKHTYAIHSKYLFGCDGARSQILRELAIPLIKKPGQGLAVNVLVKVDLTPYVQTRVGNLHWMFTPELEGVDFGWVCIARMVKPWTEWMFSLVPAPGMGVDFDITTEKCTKRVKEFIGIDSIPIEVLDVSRWYINEIVAEYYSDGNVYGIGASRAPFAQHADFDRFCLGDAVHRHPPNNGLGSNTCIQDAFNLAWKIAYVMKGLAKPSLLSSYNAERQPVGLAVITRANQGFRDHGPIFQALGTLEPTIEGRVAKLAELGHATPEGRARRQALQKGVELTSHEFHGLGIEMNQRYESQAVYASDEGPRPPLPDDPILYHEITTYPGSRLPHAWLNTKNPGKQFSTIDLAGHGVFCLITGIGGERWRDATRKVSRELGMEIASYSIGWRQDYEDVYFDWARRREVEEDGCVLLRPDRFVAWRSKEMVDDCVGKLLKVMKHVLGE